MIDLNLKSHQINYNFICFFIVVSAGHYRRENAGTDLTHEFFEKGNVIGEKIRQ